MTVPEEGRRAAIRRYVILALTMGLLSGGLITCGIIAVSKYPEPREEGEFGPPYYIGGLLVGSLVGVYRKTQNIVFF